MTNLQTLRDDYASVEADAQAIMASRDKAFADVRGKYDDKLRAATDKAAELQKELCDLEAATALADRDDLSDDDKARLAESLGLTLSF